MVIRVPMGPPNSYGNGDDDDDDDRAFSLLAAGADMALGTRLVDSVFATTVE